MKHGLIGRGRWPYAYVKRLLSETFPHLENVTVLPNRIDLDEIRKKSECPCPEFPQDDRMNLLTRQMADREGATEALKAVDQFKWVRRMNSIQNRVEEMVLSELVYF